MTALMCKPPTCGFDALNRFPWGPGALPPFHQSARVPGNTSPQPRGCSAKGEVVAQRVHLSTRTKRCLNPGGQNALDSDRRTTHRTMRPPSPRPSIVQLPF